jgi:chromate transporter
MAIHLGFLRAGWPGLIAGGVCFTLPAMLIVLALAWAYQRLGATPQAEWLLFGVKPVVIVIILQALWNLSKVALRGPLPLGVALGALTLFLLGVHEIALLFAAGLLVMVVRAAVRPRSSRLLLAPLVRLSEPLGIPGPAAPAPLGLISSAPFSLPVLFLTSLKIGAVLYGSGYVLLAFLRSDFVLRLGWLTDQQLLDAVAIGQVTPGPLFTAVTFIGYQLAGVPGGLLATVGIFLPSYLFVAVSNPLIPRLRESEWVSGLLDGVNAAALGLMAAVTWQLGRASLVDPLTVAIALLALALLLRFKLNSTWLILGGGLAGLLRAAL